MAFGHRLATLRKAIKTAPPDIQSDPEFQELKKACDLAEGIQEWRNGRIHAEVRFHESQPVLVNGNGLPLAINREACEQKIREAIRVGIAIEAAVLHLVAYELDLEELADEA
jgi:hypothetical protein